MRWQALAGALPWLGDMMPGILSHRGASLDRLVGSSFTSVRKAFFRAALGCGPRPMFSCSCCFGARFLEKTGAGKSFFIDLAFAATRAQRRGGPAKAAVIASAGMGVHLWLCDLPMWSRTGAFHHFR